MADEAVGAGRTRASTCWIRSSDVTDQVQCRDRRRARCAGAHRSARRPAKSSWSRDCEAEAGYRCRLYSFFGGTTYRLFRNLEIKDVRLVYAPPGSIGNYGGEIDNWMWPRHTGDFAFYRAYVGKDGKPAAYAEDNVPYRPKHWLKFADQPAGRGRFRDGGRLPGLDQPLRAGGGLRPHRAVVLSR